MFKAAFPYAQAEEEIAEKDYIKDLSDTASEEVAGNVWIHPDQGEWLSFHLSRAALSPQSSPSHD